jgi:uncharacterized membrane protein YhaH (DUF805 family)
VTIRRLHDTNRTGWWILLPGLFYFASMLFIALALTSPAVAVGFGAAGGFLGLIAGVLVLVLMVFMFLDGRRVPTSTAPILIHLLWRHLRLTVPEKSRFIRRHRRKPPPGPGVD